MNIFTTGECESSCEFQLADYMGDVKRILAVKSSAIPSGKSSEGDGIRCFGIVDYNILYADAEGALTCITTSSDYDFTVPFANGCEDEEKYVCEVTSSNVNVRLTGPRKLNIRSRVNALCSSSLLRELDSGELKIEEGCVAERLESKIKRERCIVSEPHEREYAESMAELEEVDADGLSILYTSGELKIYESSVESGGVRVRGELVISAIVKTDDQPPFAIKKGIPVDEIISIENLPDGAYARGGGYVTSATVGALDADGGCALNASAILELYAIVGYNEESVITEDAYLIDKNSITEYETESVSELLNMGSLETSVNLEIKRSETGYEGVREILLGAAELKHASAEVRSGELYLNGEISLSSVACEINDDSSTTYIPIKANSEFSERLPLKKEGLDGAKAVAIIRAGAVSSSIGEDTINFVCPLSVSYKIYKEMDIKCAKSCALIEEEEKKEKNKITVYYPEISDTLFEVGKRYKKSIVKLCTDNSISENCMSAPSSKDSLSGVDRLIIR